MKKSKLNYHDAIVHSINVDLEGDLVTINVTPYRKGMNYEGGKVKVKFIRVSRLELLNGMFEDLRGIFSVEKLQDKNGASEYEIWFNGDPHMKIICGDMNIVSR